MSLLLDVIPGANRIRQLWPIETRGRPNRPTSLLLYRQRVERLLSHLVESPGPALGWPLDQAAIRKLLLTDSGVIVAMVMLPGKPGTSIVVKVETGPLAAESLGHHYQVVDCLHADPDLVLFRDFVPAPLQQGTFEGHGYVVETALPGLSGRWSLWGSAGRTWLQRRALDRIVSLYEASAQSRRIDVEEFERLAGQPLRQLAEFAAAWPDGDRAYRRLVELQTLLEQTLVGRDLVLTWIHGDFWPGNLLVSWHSGTVSGIVDWDRAEPNQLPLHDLFHLLAYPVAMRRGYRLGQLMVEQFLAGEIGTAEQRLLDSLSERLDLPSDAGFRRAAVLLYWLRFVVANLTRYPERREDRPWLALNVWPVLNWRA